MKGIITFLSMLAIWYFAGMFRQTWMMVLAVTIAVLAVLMTADAIYQRRRLKLTMQKSRSIAFKKIEKEVVVHAENSSRLPVNRYKVKILLRYDNDKKGVKRNLCGCAGSRKENAGNTSEFYITAPYCGLIKAEMTQYRVYDPLTLFSSAKKMSESADILVFPVEKRMNLIMPSAGSNDDIPKTDTRAPKQGDDHSEVHLIREYRPGDLTRHIHHNYSAKTDSVWVKEFTKDNDLIFDLYLDTSDSSSLMTDDWDAFYEIVFSVLIALVRRNIAVNVHYFDREQGGVCRFDVSSEALCAEVLAKLYLSDKECKSGELFGNTDIHAPGRMLINTKLEWTFSGRPVYQFHKEKVEAELSALPFRL